LDFSKRTFAFWRTKSFWLLAALGLLILIAVLLAYFIDEPLRRRTEAEINASKMF
jgi:peptidoglycan/LPS O-acetylase OafA/YrhL